MTYSLGWCLAQVPSFLDRLGGLLGCPSLNDNGAVVRLQEHEHQTGVTDIEIHAPGYAAWVIEAKRGFQVPNRDQLEKYARRLRRLRDRRAKPGLAVLAQSDRNEQWLRRQLPRRAGGVPVHAVSWRQVRRAAAEARGSASIAGRRLLKQFIEYIGAAANMQNQGSNMVWVVSLSREKFAGGETSFIDVVEKYQKYFHHRWWGLSYRAPQLHCLPIQGAPSVDPPYRGIRGRREFRAAVPPPAIATTKAAPLPVSPWTTDQAVNARANRSKLPRDEVLVLHRHAAHGLHLGGG